MYNYEKEKTFLFTEEGCMCVVNACVLIARFNSKKFTMGDIVFNMSFDSWKTMAAVDYLKEKGFIREILQDGCIMGQNRMFISHI